MSEVRITKEQTAKEICFLEKTKFVKNKSGFFLGNTSKYYSMRKNTCHYNFNSIQNTQEYSYVIMVNLAKFTILSFLNHPVEF